MLTALSYFPAFVLCLLAARYTTKRGFRERKQSTSHCLIQRWRWTKCSWSILCECWTAIDDGNFKILCQQFSSALLHIIFSIFPIIGGQGMGGFLCKKKSYACHWRLGLNVIHQALRISVESREYMIHWIQLRLRMKIELNFVSWVVLNSLKKTIDWLCHCVSVHCVALYKSTSTMALFLITCT